MSTHEERVAALLGLQGDHDRERQLLDAKIIAYDRWTTAASGGTYLVILDGNLEAFHKAHSRLSSVNVFHFGHSFDTPPLHECAAWRFARALGPNYERLLAPTVYREIGGDAGSLALRLPGVKPAAGHAFRDGADQVNDAGFFDLLIGQQDRHLGNFLWDADTRRLGLIDHGFCFPRDPEGLDPAGGRRQRIRSEQLVSQRRFKQIRITDEEVASIERVLDSSDLLGIAPLLEPERATAMKRRLERLLDAKVRVIPRLRH